MSRERLDSSSGFAYRHFCISCWVIAVLAQFITAVQYRPASAFREVEEQEAPPISIGPALQHEDWISDVAFSRDGGSVITASRDGRAQLWDARTGNPIGERLQHEDTVVGVAFSPDGKLVLTGSSDGTARLWETASGKLFRILRHSKAVQGVDYSPDGRSVLTGSLDGTARLWDVRTGKPIGKPFQHSNPVDDVAFAPNGRLFLVRVENEVCVWVTAQVFSLRRQRTFSGFARMQL